MSGATAGGILGGVIGFVVSGFNPYGFQIGFMIGAGVGGYLKPDVIKGPRIGDAQTQLTSELAYRPQVRGSATIKGNVIMSGEVQRTKKKESAGKGGPEIETEVLKITFALRLTGHPIKGVSRIWFDDKLVADWRNPADWPEEAAAIAAMAGDSSKLLSQMTLYLGGEDQLPDPVLEALPADRGGGAGNVPSFRGTPYIVFDQLDVTARQGSVPQIKVEVVASGSQDTQTFMPDMGVQTARVTMGGHANNSDIGYNGAHGITYGSAAQYISTGQTWTQGTYDDALNISPSSTVTNTGISPCSDKRFQPQSYFGAYTISSQGNCGYCILVRDGKGIANLRPSITTNPSWWYAEDWYYPEHGGLIWWKGNSVFLGSRKTGSSGTQYNRIFKWPLRDVGGAVLAEDAMSPKVTNGVRFFLHMDRGGTIRALADTEKELVTYDDTLGEVSRVSLPFTFPSGIRAFAVDSNVLHVLYGSGNLLRTYDMETWAVLNSINLTGTFDDNSKIICTDDSIFVKSGNNLCRVDYAPKCLMGIPDGWWLLPDSPGYAFDGQNIVPLCSGTPVVTVTQDGVLLADIVTELCAQAGVTSDRLDVSQLTDTVRGFVIGKQMSAADAIRSLQQGYFFDFPEWGNYNESKTKLRAIKRGGGTQFAIVDDDLLEDSKEDDTRQQQVEFPRALNLIYADRDAGYEPGKAPAVRRTRDVRAVGTAAVELPLVLRKSEATPKAYIMLKVAWTEAEGRTELLLPPEFLQLTPSDRFSYQGKRWRCEEAVYDDGPVRVKGVRDRAENYSSTVTSDNTSPGAPPTSSIRGPTMFAGVNVPRLSSSHVGPGLYVGVAGRLDGWVGCDLMMSVDGGLTYTKVLEAYNEANMGTLVNSSGTSGEPITVQLYEHGELTSATAEQLLLRQNAFVMVTDGVAEVAQFRDPSDTGNPNEYDLSTIYRGELGTVAAVHYAGDRFMLLDSNIYFLPISVDYAGTTLKFKPVSRGTAEANTQVYDVLYLPKFTGAATPQTYVDDTGDAYVDENGSPYYSSEV